MTIVKADSILQVGVIPTGLPQLNRILGIGGIPFQRITEISGSWSVGKTTLAFQIVKSAQDQGLYCIWYDAEYSFDTLYAEKLGVNTKKLGLLQGRIAEDSLDELLEYVEKGKDTLIVIDAVGALHPRDEAEKASGDRTIGSQSGLVARFCRKIVPMLALNNNALIVLNHEYTPIVANGGRPQLMTSGGKKLEYHKSMWIRLSKTGTNLKDGENFAGFVVQAEIRKNKLAATQKQSCEMELVYDRGFNPTSDLGKEALEKGVLVKKGQFYWLGEEKVARGERGLREQLAEPVFASRLQELIKGV